MLQQKFKRGDKVVLRWCDIVWHGKVVATKERSGYITVKWDDGRTTHVWAHQWNRHLDKVS